MTKIKVNHFAAKTLNAVSYCDKENIAIAIVILIFSCTMMYAGYKTHSLLFIMALIVGLVAAILLLVEVFGFFRRLFFPDKNSPDEHGIENKNGR